MYMHIIHLQNLGCPLIPCHPCIFNIFDSLVQGTNVLFLQTTQNPTHLNEWIVNLHHPKSKDDIPYLPFFSLCSSNVKLLPNYCGMPFISSFSRSFHLDFISPAKTRCFDRIPLKPSHLSCFLYQEQKILKKVDCGETK